MKPVLIVDYGMGNLRSVGNAFAALGCEATISSDPDTLEDAARVVLPGVGAFANAMQNLRERGWIDALNLHVRERGKPLLGLCLGMQLLAQNSAEHGQHEGLRWIEGTVEMIQAGENPVPHIGWNEVRFTRSEGLYSGLGESATFYFVHSYILKTRDEGVISGFCCYGEEFVSSIETGNLFATQFHPEKSQKAGLHVLRRFLEVTASSCSNTA